MQSEDFLNIVFRAIILAKITYALPAWLFIYDKGHMFDLPRCTLDIHKRT